MTRIMARLFSFFLNLFYFSFAFMLLPEPSPLQLDAYNIMIWSLGVTLVQCSHYEELAPRKKLREKEGGGVAKYTFGCVEVARKRHDVEVGEGSCGR